MKATAASDAACKEHGIGFRQDVSQDGPSSRRRTSDRTPAASSVGAQTDGIELTAASRDGRSCVSDGRPIARRALRNRPTMARVSFARAFFDETDRSAAGFISQKGVYARLRPAGLFGSAIACLRIRGGVVASR